MGGALIPAQRTLVLTALAMVAFAANSVLCRLALREGAIDAASFTAVRLVSGAVALGLILLLRDRSVKAMATQGNQGRRWRCLSTLPGSRWPTLNLPRALAPCCCLAQCRPP